MINRFPLILFVLFSTTVLLSCKKDIRNGNEIEIPAETAKEGFIISTTDFVFLDEEVTLVFDLSKGNKELMQEKDGLYLHAGLITSASASEKDWKHVTTEWGKADAAYKLKHLEANKFSISFVAKDFFNISEQLSATHIALLIRNMDGSKVARNKDGSDMYIPIRAKNQLQIGVSAPVLQPTYQEITEQDEFEKGYDLPLVFAVSAASAVEISLNNEVVNTFSQTTKVDTKIRLDRGGLNRLSIKATSANQSVQRDIYVMVSQDVTTAELPSGAKANGVTINNSTKKVVFALSAPSKSCVYLLGSFNDYVATEQSFMKRTADGNTWWIEVSDLDFSKQHTYQFLVDGQIRIADPYAVTVLDPEHDTSIQIPAELPSYPTGKTSGIVSVLNLSPESYTWQSTSYVRPHPYDLVIYELHVRDFLEKKNYTTLRDSIPYLKALGVNAIELMPVQEFEGNSSWGYNPSYHFALDKYYGSAKAFKQFVDACHANGIAVILDVVLNHAFGQSPLAQLYMQGGVLQANNPWFNVVPTHPFNVGYDFNHESPLTKQFAKDVMRYWIEEYKIDGYRFDLSKGFTQKNSGTAESSVGTWSAYDASRVALWKEYNNFIKAIDTDFYVILEHFADDQEERELANEGMFLWNNLNHNFNEASMGYIANSDLSRLFPQSHGFTQPRLISYMESHDEERLMFKNQMYGNTGSGYSTKTLTTALNRMEQAATFLLFAPGPKMIWQFGEIGYDISINENGRTGDKPSKWNYRSDANRANLLKHYARLIHFKKENTVFRNPASEYVLTGAVKYYILQQGNQKVMVVGNFDVVNQSFQVSAAMEGPWYDNLNSGSTVNWSVGQTIQLSPGQYYLLSKDILK